jgi:hypothetical protein
MAQTKKKRRRKRRGTQGGRIDTKPTRGRPRTKAEAQARARQGSSARGTKTKADLPPTWRGSVTRGGIAAVLFAAILILLFKRPVGVSLLFGAFMLAFYVPAGYYIDMTLWRRRERQRIRERESQ